MLASELFHNHGKSFKNEDTIRTKFDSASYLITSLRQGHPHLVQADSSSNLARTQSRSVHSAHFAERKIGLPRPFFS